MSETTDSSDSTMTLSSGEVAELRQLIAELYFPARAHGPVPIQREYWPEVLALLDKWQQKLQPTEAEITRMADEAYERATRRFGGTSPTAPAEQTKKDTPS